MSIETLQIILVTTNPQDVIEVNALLREDHPETTVAWVPEIQEVAESNLAEQSALILWALTPELATATTFQAQLDQIAQQAPLILLVPAELESLALPLCQNIAHDYLLREQLSETHLRRGIRYARRLFSTEQNARQVSTAAILNETIANLKAVWEAAGDAMVLSDKEGIVLRVNEAYLALYGFDRESVEGRPFTIIFPEDQREWAMNGYRSIFTNPKSLPYYDLTILTVDGKTHMMETHIGFVHQNGRRIAMLSTIRDVTERIQTEQRLQQSEQRFRTIFTHSGIGMAIADLDGLFLQTNPMFRQMTGYTEDELVYKTISDITFPGDIEKELVLIALIQKGEIETYQIEKRYVHKRGHTFWVLLTVALVRDEEGVPQYFVGQVQDISRQKINEIELRKLSHVVEQSPVSVLVTNTEAEIEYVNPRFVQVTGFTLAEVMGKNARILQSGKTPNATYQAMWRALKLGQVWRGEFLNKKKNGELFWEEVSMSPVINAQGQITHYVAIKEDVTERKSLEKQAQYQERLASVGQLAAGIAHDFNNILAVIMLYSQLMQTAESLNDRDKKHLGIIVQQANRASDLIQQILDFSRQSVLEKRPLDMLATIREMVRMLSRTLPENIQLRVAHEHDLHTVNADPTRIQQMLMNLCVNARDAMPQGGQLIIELKHLNLDTQLKRPFPEMENGRWTYIKISDTGVGIAEENLLHIFDPFFTTKEPGQGTGLGLAQVYGIVKQHDGHIAVDSIEGQGTQFSIYFPALLFPQPDAVSDSARQPHQGNGETILIVEDEKMTRQTLADILENLGYNIITAKDGVMALEKLASTDHIDLILSDMVMPRMGGKELLQNLHQQHISLPVIILSGYALQEDMGHLRKLGMKGWLAKPPNLDRLAELISQTLA